MIEKKTLRKRIHDALFWEDGKIWHNKEARELARLQKASGLHEDRLELVKAVREKSGKT